MLTRSFESERARFRAAAAALRAECEQANAVADAVRAQREQATAAATAMAGRLDAEQARSADLAAVLARTREELAVLRGSTTMRVRDRLLATPLLGNLVRLGLRLAKSGGARLRPVRQG